MAQLAGGESLGDEPLLSDAYAAHAAGRAVPLRERLSRRVVEAAVAAGVLVLIAPLLLVLAALVRITSPGPVLFRQTRIGLDGRPFTMLKFRSMWLGAEQERVRLSHLNEASGPLFKIRGDPRLTRVGRWMRRYSLDELPQLVNVVAGTMALVGPRPVLPAEARMLTATEQRRHVVRPGLTGLAQVSGRSDLAWADMVALDLHYVAHRSLALDLWIIVRTVGAVLTARGAY